MTIGRKLSEQDQISACKQLGSALAEYINCFGKICNSIKIFFFS
jgi:hypothetical protein